MSRFARGMLSTVPIVLAGSLAVGGLNLSGAIDTDNAKPAPKPKSQASSGANAFKAAFASANDKVVSPAAAAEATEPGVLSVASAPSTYRVQGGDTVSSIAGRYGLSTASVLALNGLGWKSVIFPGQTLKLTNAVVSVAPAAVTPAAAPSSAGSSYTIATGDTVSSIASKFGVSTTDILSANGLGWSSVIYAGRTLTIPGSSSPAPAAPAPVVEVQPAAAVAPLTGETYLIKSGDTISAIAQKFGVSVQSILNANGLSLSSIIFSGQTLKISSSAAPSAPSIAPAAAAPAVVVSPPTSGAVTQLSAEMSSNAQTIVRVGQRLGVPEYGIVIALAAAMQESSLRNIDYGDRDSLGLFQQRPSTGWGTPDQLLNPEHSALLFYGGPSNPNKGVTRGLLEISGWQSMPLTQAAQRVQISAYPDAYAKWEASARAWYAALK
ncbi:MAG TPA: LysM peptidoglycan-binding domain-containing protein [Glaciihabitans sp.]|nr:LysM peptidoglycan-binding domain-containing protein [Glaciihabitans sp.]